MFVLKHSDQTANSVACLIKKTILHLTQDSGNEMSLPSLPLPLFISPPLGSVAFHAPLIDRHDGFPEPIRKESP